MARKYRDFESAREFARKLGFRTYKQWQEYCKSVNYLEDIPSEPQDAYKKNWKGWGDWLGSEYVSFHDAKIYALKLHLSGSVEWKKINHPNWIPRNPDKTYKNEWRGWGDFLDSKNKPNRFGTFLDYEDAKKIVQELEIRSSLEWKRYANSNKLPKNIPRDPRSVYKKQWKGWGDWLRSGEKIERFLNFNEAREFVRSLKLNGTHEWNRYCKFGDKPDDIPSSPYGIYKNKGWRGYGDWLGTGRVANKNFEYRDFESARAFVRGFKLKGVVEWREYCKSGNKPDDIPKHPDQTYKNKGWIGYGDWLGTGRVANQTISKRYLPFKEARKQVRILAKQYNIKNRVDWENAVKNGLIPDNIPSFPNAVYSKKRMRKK